MTEARKPVILSGMQPTGRLHLGNYEGALRNWVDLQNSGKYQCYFCIVDYHALTTRYAEPEGVRNDSIDVFIDYLSAGLDPDKSVIFRQSDVKQHTELNLLFSMITPMSWLERVPTFKEKKEYISAKDEAGPSAGLLGYPVLQAADIAIYKGEFVPVGKDQIPHLELTREIVRRFNFYYGEIFPEPQPLLTKAPVLPGLDNRKMSKSYNNHILISESPESISTKISTMYTDPERIQITDKGHPLECPVYALHQLYNPEHNSIPGPCSEGSKTWGCVKCKKTLAEAIISYFAPFRTKRLELEQNPTELERLLKSGADKARIAAEQTMQVVRKAIVG
jgi:tryptophanyl-tRNA synthetase